MISTIFRSLIKFILNLPENPLKKAIRDIFYGDVITERIFEYAAVARFITKPPANSVHILDVGCYYSNFSIQQASLGYKVTGVDLQAYQLTHPNFTFIQGDIRTDCLQKEKFDYVTCVSTIEHIGIGYYDNKIDKRGDKLAFATMTNHLQNKGVIIISIPFGIFCETDSYRVYDWQMVKDLVKNLKLIGELYYMEKNGKWFPCTRQVASKIQSKDKTRAVAVIAAQKN